MKLEPVAWATEDGRVAMSKTRDEAMPNAAKVSFTIPLVHIPEGYVVVPVEVTDKIPQWLLDAIDQYAAVADDDAAAMEARAFAVRKLREWQAMLAAKEQS